MTDNEKRRLHTKVFIIAFHAAIIPAYFLFSWTGLVAGCILWFIANCPGVGIGFHRLLTHRGFKTPKWLEYTLSTAGSLALQGDHRRWVAIHRVHHQDTDVPDKDPHTPLQKLSRFMGFAWAQWLWMMQENKATENEMLVKKYAPDIAKDNYHALLGQYWWVPFTVVGVLLFFVGSLTSWFDAFSYLLCGAIVPTAIGWQITWTVNSINHMWGSRPNDTGDVSTNNFWMAIPTFGESWHNNHHYSPRSVRHGWTRYQIDINYYVILLFKKVGWATDLILPDVKK